MSNTKTDQKGFTLLELLVAISILTVGLLGLATMMSSGIGSDRFAHTVAVEGSVGSLAVEELTSRDGDDPVFASTVAGATYDLDPGSAATTRVVNGRTYSATYSVTPNTPVTGVATVSVSITSGTRTVTLNAFKSTI
jgi:type IV pilus assembly protein PilV